MDEKCVLLGCYAASSGNYLTTFRHNLGLIFGVKRLRLFLPTRKVHIQGDLLRRPAASSAQVNNNNNDHLQKSIEMDYEAEVTVLLNQQCEPTELLLAINRTAQ